MKPTLVLSALRALRAAEEDVGFDGLELRAKELLRIIAEEEILGEPLKVGDLIKRVDFGTSPTIYSALSELERAGLVLRTIDATDGRSRRLTTTDVAKKLFERAELKAREALDRR